MGGRLALLDIIRKIEGRSDEKRREIICNCLDSLSIEYIRQEYGDWNQNIIVKSDKTDEIGISSHFDVFCNQFGLCPGANDNASAVAVTIDVLNKTKGKLKNIGVRGLFFDEEECGLKGSRYYVENNGIEGLMGLVNMELVGMGDCLGFWAVDEIFDGYLLRTVESIARRKEIKNQRFPYIKKFLGNTGDHRSFIEKGLNEVFCLTVLSEKDIDVALTYMNLHCKEVDEKLKSEVVKRAPIFEHYHQQTDMSRYLSEESLRMVSDLLYDTIIEIDRNY